MRKLKRITKKQSEETAIAVAARAQSHRADRIAISQDFERYDADQTRGTAYPDVYALRVRGACLAPTIPDDCHVICDSRLSVVPGDIVVVHFCPERVRPGGDTCILKRLVIGPPNTISFPFVNHPDSNLVPAIILEMDNPKRRLAVPCDAVMAIHRCVGPVDESKVDYFPGAKGGALRFHQRYWKQFQAEMGMADESDAPRRNPQVQDAPRTHGRVRRKKAA